MAPAQFPTEGVVLTHLLVVSDLERSRHFYRDVLGASVYREYGGTSCVLLFQGSWLLLVTGGGPLTCYYGDAATLFIGGGVTLTYPGANSLDLSAGPLPAAPGKVRPSAPRTSSCSRRDSSRP